jgi:uncharacterized membrane protein
MPPATDLLGFPLALAGWLLFVAVALGATVAVLHALDWLLSQAGA